MKKYIYIALLLLLIIAISIFLWIQTNTEKCVEETVCPIDLGNETEDLTKDWHMSLQQNSTFKYPQTLGYAYIHKQDWPPLIDIQKHAFVCEEISTPQNNVQKRMINMKEYCVNIQKEGAAGSVYTTYVYQTMKEDAFISLTFTLREVQCLNFDQPQQTECQNEQDSFNPDLLADQIMQTVTWNRGSISEFSTLKGEYVCLYPKDITSPKTLDCALGIKTDAGQYYVLDATILETAELFGEPTGTRIIVEGNITPIEFLSTDHWQQYDIKGIMTVVSLKVEK